MTNIEILELIGCVGDVRQRMEAEDEDDTSFDDEINEMSAKEIAEKWSGWNLGSEQWAEDIINIYEQLKEHK